MAVSVSRPAKLAATAERRQGVRGPSFARIHGPSAATRRQHVVAAALVTRTAGGRKTKTKSLEGELLETLKSAKGRGKEGLTAEQQSRIAELVDMLEADGGVADPTAREDINGQWRLLYTSRPGTSSPIQRTFTGVDSFRVYQEVFLQDEEMARINNCVDFGNKVGVLRVEAEANIDTRPIPGFTPRRGAGFPLLGKSSTEPPAAENMRIDFQFDRAAFNFNALPFKIPYPVPFRLVGDEGKGWIDVTYLSEDASFRISRGNKGTTFILTKEKSVQEQLLQAIAGGDEAVTAMIETLENPTKAPATSPLTQGKWRLRWSAQAENANFLQKSLADKVQNFQILFTDEEGTSRVENLVDFGFLKIRAEATCEPASAERTTVDISRVVFDIGPFQIPFEVNRNRGDDNPVGYVDWLYLDESVRVTRGSKGSLFVHTRDDQ